MDNYSLLPSVGARGLAMQVTFELTPDDLWHYTLYFRRHKALIRTTFFYALAGLLSIVFIGGIWTIFEVWLKNRQIDWIMLFLLGVMLYFTTRFLPPMKNRLVKIASRQSGLLCEHVYSISPEWLSEKTPVSDNKTAWITLRTIEEDAKYLYFFVSAASAHVIPKRAFNSLAEAQAFLDKSRHYWQGAKDGTLVPAEDSGIWPPAPRPGA